MDQRFDRKWALLHDTHTGRWHPIEFYACPLPSDPEFTIPRHYSLCHHTDGTASKDDAIRYIEILCEQNGMSDCSYHVIAWDGSPIRGMCAYLIPKPKQETAA